MGGGAESNYCTTLSGQYQSTLTKAALGGNFWTTQIPEHKKSPRKREIKETGVNTYNIVS
jgi:hypothetical protein